MKIEIGEMKTLSGVMNILRERGYTVDFNIDPCKKDLMKNPDGFVIDKVYRFEGTTDPGDESILFAISSKGTGLKGMLTNGYGIYSNSEINEIMGTLKYDESIIEKVL